MIAMLITLSHLGYLGISLGLMVEIIPSEIVLSYGGFLISQGKLNFIGTLLAGTIGGTIAQWFLYWIGCYGGRPFLEKYGKYLFIKKRHMDIAEAWFHKYGPGVIFTARFIPVVRHAISIPAGISKMSFLKFTLYTLLAVIPWTLLFLNLGMQLGSNWDRINEMAKPYVQPITILALVMIVSFVGWSMYKKTRKKATH
jgi:membrane protein DedA with SNARE-associated domain